MKMIASRMLAVAVFAASILAACQSGSSDSAVGAKGGDAAHGQQVFTVTCVTCHGPDAKGVKGLGKSLIDSTWLKKASDVDVTDLIITGREANDRLNTTGVAMPPKGGNAALTDADIRDLVAYLRTINKG